MMVKYRLLSLAEWRGGTSVTMTTVAVSAVAVKHFALLCTVSSVALRGLVTVETYFRQ